MKILILIFIIIFFQTAYANKKDITNLNFKPSVAKGKIGNSYEIVKVGSGEPVIGKSKIWDTRLRLRYSMQELYSDNKIKWNKTFWINTDIDVNLTSEWKMTYSARFDNEKTELVSHSIYLFRPLHCWEFSFKWWPSGNSKGFILNIYVKNPDLRDIKIKSTGGRFFGL